MHGLTDPATRPVGAARARDLRDRITSATAAYAAEPTDFYRDNLARAMRIALHAGLSLDDVVARSALPRAEAERLLAGPATRTVA